MPSEIKIHALDHLVFNVLDVERSVLWYGRVLSLRSEVSPENGRTSLHFGSQKINLRPFGTDPDEWFTAARPIPGSEDLCFLTDQSPEQVVAHLGECGVAIEKGPVDKSGARGTLRSVYCRDPDGNLVEISSYPT